MKVIEYVDGSKENLTPDADMKQTLIEFYNSDKEVFVTGQDYAISCARALVVKRVFDGDNIYIKFGDWETYVDKDGRITYPPDYEDHVTNTLIELAGW